MRDSVHDRCRGRWQSILLQMGADPKWLRNVHQPCPFCGGKDRYRFDDKERGGTYFCSGCGAGTGVDFVMNLKGVDFVGALKLIEAVIGGSPLDVRRRHDPASPDPYPVPPLDNSVNANKMRELWMKSSPLDGADAASHYLKARYLTLKAWPTALRWARGVPYYLDRQFLGCFSVMLSRFIAPDDSRAILQRTYLDGEKKAEVPQARKMMAGPIPQGGAVRLFPAAEVMGVAEGVETALAASLLHRDMPVWATLSSASLLKFEPPSICKKLVIFGDSDLKAGGQVTAWALSHRLETRKNPIETEVRIPGYGAGNLPLAWAKIRRDWNDVLAEVRNPGVR